MATSVGKTPLRLSGSDPESKIVRAMQVLPVFDRTQLTVIAAEPYGSVSRVLAQLKNEGYVEEVLDAEEKIRSSYNQASLKRNPDLKGVKLNYGKGNNLIAAQQYKKSQKWTEFMTRGRAARIGHSNRNGGH